MNYKLIKNSLFFRDLGILAIGDLHIGYERMLTKSGLALPETQTEAIIEDLKKIFEDIKSNKNRVKKIVFLGDIKHHFGFEWKERDYFMKIMEFLKKQKLKDSDIILIKGNHDKFDFSGKKMKNYWLKEGILFIHGHKEFDILKPKKNAKGNRMFTPEDVKNLQLIYHLVKERGFTLEGAKIHLKEGQKKALDKFDIINKLETIKAQLNTIKNQL